MLLEFVVSFLASLNVRVAAPAGSGERVSASVLRIALRTVTTDRGRTWCLMPVWWGRKPLQRILLRVWGRAGGIAYGSGDIDRRTPRGAPMSDLFDLDETQQMSREAAAARLRALADSLDRHNSITFQRESARITV